MSKRTEKLKYLQLLFNRYIRQRDSGKPCIYCGQPVYGFAVNMGHSPTAAHYMPVSIAGGLRFDTDNAHLAGYECNQKDDRDAYRKNLIARIGIHRVKSLESQKVSLAKMSLSELEEKIEHFRRLLKY